MSAAVLWVILIIDPPYSPLGVVNAQLEAQASLLLIDGALGDHFRRKDFH